MNTIKSLIKKREKLLMQLKRSQNFMRGSFYKTERKCGKGYCWCSSSKKGHVARMLTLKIKGAQKSLVIPADKEEEIKKMVEEYKKLRKLIDELTEINMEIIRGSR